MMGFGFYGLLIGLFYFVGIVVGAALLVLIFMVLLKANKLLQILIDKENQDKNQKPPQ